MWNFPLTKTAKRWNLEMANPDTRDGRTQGKEGRSARRLGRGACAPGTPGNTWRLQGAALKDGHEKQYPKSRESGCSFSLSTTARGLGSLEVESRFPLPRPCRHTLQKLLKQTERTLSGLLSFRFFPRSRFLVLELSFDFFGSLFF